MSKKKLLEESTIRSFMKLANLQPLTSKFLKESESLEEESLEEGELEEEVVEEAELEEETLEEAELEEEVVDEGDAVEEGKETAGRTAPKKEASKAKLTPKATVGVDGAKSVKAPGKVLKPLKAGTHHSGKPDSVQSGGTHPGKHGGKHVKTKRPQFEIKESLEEMSMEEDDLAAPEEAGGEEMGSAGEGGDHQEMMKQKVRDMLDILSDIGGQYGLTFDIKDDTGEPGEEEPGAPEEPGEAAEQEPTEEPEAGEAALEEMVERLTKRVASRLVKESKKKR